jgi:hypothetical protein
MAAAGEADSEPEAARTLRAPLRKTLEEMLRSKAVNPECAICGANRATWRFEVRRTMFATMAEAGPEMAELEAANAVTNRLFGDLHKQRPN